MYVIIYVSTDAKKQRIKSVCCIYWFYFATMALERQYQSYMTLATKIWDALIYLDELRIDFKALSFLC